MLPVLLAGASAAARAQVSTDIKLFCRTRCANDYRGFDACYAECVRDRTGAEGAGAGQEQELDPNAVGTDPGRGHAITIGGLYFFPIGLFNVFPEDFKSVKEAGFNLVYMHTSCCNEDELDMHEHFLAEAGRLGLKAILMPVYPPERIENADETELRLLSRAVQRRASRPALMGWFLFPRPLHKENISPEQIKKIRFFTSENDPAHPLIAAVSQQDAIMDYMPAANWFMVAPWPLPYYPIHMVRDQVRAAVAAAAGQRPVLALLQAHYDTGIFSLSFGNVRPSEEELYNMAHQAIANGAKGIMFRDAHGERMDVKRSDGPWRALARVVSDLNANSFIFNLKDSARKPVLDPPGAPVDLLLKEDDNAYFLLVVSYSRRHLDIRINLSGLDAARVEAMPLYLRPDLFVSPPKEKDAPGSDIVPLQDYNRRAPDKDTGQRNRLRKFDYSEKVLAFEMRPIDVWWFRIEKPGAQPGL